MMMNILECPEVLKNLNQLNRAKVKKQKELLWRILKEIYSDIKNLVFQRFLMKQKVPQMIVLAIYVLEKFMRMLN